MRKTANVSRTDTGFRRAMIYDPGDGGVFLFLFRTDDDAPCEADCWYGCLADAERDAADELGIGAGDWKPVPDPEPGCPHDRLPPNPDTPGGPEGVG